MTVTPKTNLTEQFTFYNCGQ